MVRANSSPPVTSFAQAAMYQALVIHMEFVGLMGRLPKQFLICVQAKPIPPNRQQRRPRRVDLVWGRSLRQYAVVR
jgi:hypothetical protein